MFYVYNQITVDLVFCGKNYLLWVKIFGLVGMNYIVLITVYIYIFFFLTWL